jgi:hypothetical protein
MDTSCKGDGEGWGDDCTLQRCGSSVPKDLFPKLNRSLTVAIVQEGDDIEPGVATGQPNSQAHRTAGLIAEDSRPKDKTPEVQNDKSLGVGKKSADIEACLSHTDSTNLSTKRPMSERISEGSNLDNLHRQRGPSPTIDTHPLASRVNLRELAGWFQKEYERADALMTAEQDEWSRELMFIREATAGTAQSD